MTQSTTRAAHATSAWLRLASFAKRALRVELRIYASIARLVARKPAIPAGASGFSYHRPVLTVLVIFIVLSAVEIPVIDLIVHRWPAVRIAFLVLGIWGLTWMVGLLAAYLTRPHTVGPGGVSVREGLELDLELPWADIASVALDRRVDEPKSPRIVETDTTRSLNLRMQDETNIEIELEGPTLVRLPGLPPKGGPQEVTHVRLWTDDPKRFMEAVRTHMP